MPFVTVENRFLDSSDSLATQGHLGVTARSHAEHHGASGLSSGDGQKSVTYQAHVKGDAEMTIPKGSPVPEDRGGRGSVKAEFIPDRGSGRGIWAHEDYSAKGLQKSQNLDVVRRVEVHQLSREDTRGGSGANSREGDRGRDREMHLGTSPGIKDEHHEGTKDGQQRTVDAHRTDSDKSQAGNNQRVDPAVVYTHQTGQPDGVLSRPDRTFTPLPKPQNAVSR